MRGLITLRLLYRSTLLLILVVACPTLAQAENKLREETSLAFVPADVAFYQTSLRLREQYDALVGSRAFQRLVESSLGQMAKAQLQAAWQEPMEGYRRWVEQPENRQLMQLVRDAVSQEVFIYGNEGFAELIGLTSRINSATNEARFQAMLEGEDPNEAPPDLMLEVILEHFEQHPHLPDLVIGFKLREPQIAKEQSARLEQLIRQQLAEVLPDLDQRLRRESVGETEYLVLSLDGALLPWDQMRETTELDAAEFDRFQKAIEPIKLVLAVGVRGNYLLLSIGDSLEHLQPLGERDLLVDREEFEALRAAGDKRFVQVSYASQSFLQRAYTLDKQLADWAENIRQSLQTDAISEELRKEMVADVEWLAEALRQYLPRPGAMMSYSYLSDRGYEGFTYSWSENLRIDASQPLSILDHLGGRPIIALARRRETSADTYGLLRRLVQRTFYYGEQIFLPQLSDEQKQAYEQFRAIIQPLVQRLDEINRERLLPAFAEGQAGLVFDAQWTSKQWHQLMPPAEQPLPMFAVALVYSINDPEQVRKAAEEYRAAIQEAITKLHEVAPQQVPDLQLPAAESEPASTGTIYKYPLPAALGLDPQIAPNAGLSENFLVLSISPELSRRMLESHELPQTTPLDRRDQPLGAAVYFDFAGMVDAVTPWIRYAVALGPGGGPQAQQDPAVEQIMQQVQIVLDFVKTLKGYSNVAYREGDALVQHHEWVFEDVKEED